MKKQENKKSIAKPNVKKKTDKEPEPEIEDIGPHIFEILNEQIKNNYIPENKRDKAFLIDYTVAILKPNLISSSRNCKTLVEKIEKSNFEIYNFIHKTLTHEEILNLYYKHTTKEYFNEIQDYMNSGPSAIFILINKEQFYVDENGIKTEYKSPIIRWKELIGDKEPSGDTLRGEYGTDIIRNEFWGSDSPRDAYRELNIFLLPLPAKPPKFCYDNSKLTLNTIMKFLIPVKPNHPDICGRLDIIAKYGPILNKHMIDVCICSDCKPVIKNILLEKGINLKKSKDKILDENFINEYNNKFCSHCLDHFNKWAHLYSGFDFTHILTNEEINLLIDEMNKKDILEILKSEKGSCAETVLSKFDLNKPPSDIIYTKLHVLKLLSELKTDYYDRYDFYEMQNIILEDRRIRLNFWISSIINKPCVYFKNPKLINDLSLNEINNVSGKNFTLLRTLPIKVKNEEEDKLKSMIVEHPILIKDKLSDFEINSKIEKLMSLNLCKITTKESQNNKNITNNMILLRNFNLKNK